MIQSATRAPLVLTVVAAMVSFAAVSWLDLNPRVEPDFFFSDEDPQFQESAAIDRSFPTSTQFLIRAAGPVRSDTYQSRLSTVVTHLQTLDGVRSIRSILNTPALDDPVWQPLLLNTDESASYLIVDVDADEAGGLVDPIRDYLETGAPPEIEFHLSGVPYVIELIERFLFRDLTVFSLAAFAIFGGALTVVYRRAWIVFGALATCVVSAVLTLSAIQLVGISLGLLTANLVTITFILTLSHVVFLTSNWRGLSQGTIGEVTSTDHVRGAILLTREASFWCMATTSLGFLSLLLATARPLRDLGVAGSTGTLIAILVAYTMFPWFLRASAAPRRTNRSLHWLPTGRLGWLIGIAAIVVSVGFGVTKLSTDPNLLAYFTPGGPIRSGLDIIDDEGGSSPLRIVARHESGIQLDRGPGAALVGALHDSILLDPSVGSVVSPALLFAEIARSPLVANRPASEVLDLPIVEPFIRPFLSSDRTRAHFLLRMHESGRTEARRDIIARIESTFDRGGLPPVQVGGLYQLQAQLADLVSSSLRIAIAGLIILFTGIAWIISRSPRTVASMTLCLIAIPAVVLGTFGHLGIAIDIISSPAANVALAMGVDSMIHVVIRVRRLRQDGQDLSASWTQARQQLWHPVVGAGLIIGAGFAIFTLSTFPPTDRFGLAVVLGTATAVVMALVGLPMMVARER